MNLENKNIKNEREFLETAIPWDDPHENPNKNLGYEKNSVHFDHPHE